MMNKSNTVKDLTMDQIKGIYTGTQTTNWKGIEGGKRCTWDSSCINKRRRFWNKGCFPRNNWYESEELTKRGCRISNGTVELRKQ